MTYATFFTPRGFALMFATGPNSKPTPDGGPWVCEYAVSELERSEAVFDVLERASRNAETLLWRAVKRDAPGPFLRARELGWTADT
jgi:hypothetical protein